MNEESKNTAPPDSGSPACNEPVRRLSFSDIRLQLTIQELEFLGRFLREKSGFGSISSGAVRDDLINDLTNRIDDWLKRVQDAK